MEGKWINEREAYDVEGEGKGRGKDFFQRMVRLKFRLADRQTGRVAWSGTFAATHHNDIPSDITPSSLSLPMFIPFTK